MTVSLASYRVSPGEKPASSSKQNNMLTALENALNAIPASQLVGFPGNATRYLDGSGNWSAPAGSAGAVPPSSIVGYPANAAVFLSGAGTWVAPSILGLGGLSGNALQFFNGGGAWSVPSLLSLAGFPSNPNVFLRGDASFVQPNILGLAGFSGVATQYLDGSGAWSTPAAGGGGGSGITVYAKTTAMDITGTSKQDLLNGEITIAANAMSVNGAIKVSCGGDYWNNNAASNLTLEHVLGSTTLWSQQTSTTIPASSARRGWTAHFIYQAMGSTSAQWMSGLFLMGRSSPPTTGSAGALDASNDTNGFSYIGVFVGQSSEVMTAAKVLRFNAQNSVSGSVRLRWARVEVM